MTSGDTHELDFEADVVGALAVEHFEVESGLEVGLGGDRVWGCMIVVTTDHDLVAESIVVECEITGFYGLENVLASKAFVYKRFGGMLLSNTVKVSLYL